MNDYQMIQAFKHNETTKIHEVIAKYSPLLFYVAQNILKEKGTTEDIEECVADVFIYLWQHPNCFNAKKGTLKNYLCLIAKSKALDKYRKLNKSQDVHIPLSLISEEHTCFTHLDLSMNASLAHYEYEDLYKVLDMLSSKDKEILLRRYIGGEKPAQIAKDLGVSTKSIINNLYHSKNKLKMLIQLGGIL